jgi:hypothetical protein
MALSRLVRAVPRRLSFDQVNASLEHFPFDVEHARPTRRRERAIRRHLPD